MTRDVQGPKQPPAKRRWELQRLLFPGSGFLSCWGCLFWSWDVGSSANGDELGSEPDSLIAICHILGQLLVSVRAPEIRRGSWVGDELQIPARPGV